MKTYQQDLHDLINLTALCVNADGAKITRECAERITVRYEDLRTALTAMMVFAEAYGRMQPTAGTTDKIAWAKGVLAEAGTERMATVTRERDTLREELATVEKRITADVMKRLGITAADAQAKADRLQRALDRLWSAVQISGGQVRVNIDEVKQINDTGFQL